MEHSHTSDPTEKVSRYSFTLTIRLLIKDATFSTKNMTATDEFLNQIFMVILYPESPSTLSVKQKKTLLDNQIILLNVWYYLWLLHSVTLRGFSVAVLENKMEDIKEYQKQ